MLTELALTNFKPFGREQRAPLAPITLIYGPNSGGKSSLIQALLLLRQSLRTRSAESTNLITRGPEIDLGSFRSLIHKHDLARPLTIAVRYRPSSTFVQPPHITHMPWRYERRISLTYRPSEIQSNAGSINPNESVLERARYQVYEEDQERLNATLLREENPLDMGLIMEDWEATSLYMRYGFDHDARAFRWESPSSHESLARFFTSTDETWTPKASPRKTRRKPLSDSARYDAASRTLKDTCVLVDGGLPMRITKPGLTEEEKESTLHLLGRCQVIETLGFELSGLLSSISYVGPLRTRPERHYNDLGSAPNTVGLSGEFTAHTLHRHQLKITDKINHWFGELGIPYELSIRHLTDEITGGLIVLSLLDKRTNVPVAPSDVGFGIGQILPILVEGLNKEEHLICVEQPELHLHPRLQAKLADFFIDRAPIQSKKQMYHLTLNQWIIETHSEALMLRLQRRIREGTLKASDVSVLYVDPTSQGSVIRQLRLDDDGEFLDTWPHGFFEERYDEQFGTGI